MYNGVVPVTSLMLAMLLKAPGIRVNIIMPHVSSKLLLTTTLDRQMVRICFVYYRLRPRRRLLESSLCPVLELFQVLCTHPLRIRAGWQRQH